MISMAGSLRASQQGLKIVDQARRKRGWNKDAPAWVDAANELLRDTGGSISRSTLLRFWKPQPIWQENFVAICKSVGIDNWEDLVDESPVQIEEALEANSIDQETDSELATWQGEKYYGKFIGRSDELQELLKRLESQDSPQVFGIVGIGGLGKTAFCHQLVYRAYTAKLFKKVAWIRARIYQYCVDTSNQPTSQPDSRLTLEDALRDLGKEFNLPYWMLQDPERLRKEIINSLRANRYLIVVDGLEDTESPELLATELRKLLGKSCVILTSRKKIGGDTSTYQLPKLNREISREFIYQVAHEKYPVISQNPIEDASNFQIEAILDVTDGMPLAMKLLVSQAGILELDRIIERLKTVPEERQLYDYIFEDTWNQLERENAIDAQILLIHLANLIAPIPIYLLYGLSELSNAQIDTALKKLDSFSLVEINKDKSSQQRHISLHSFTARYVNETLQSRYE